MDFFIAAALFVLFFLGMVIFWSGFHKGEPYNPEASWGPMYGRGARRDYSNSQTVMPADVQHHRVRSMIAGASLMAAAVAHGVVWTALSN